MMLVTETVVMFLRSSWMDQIHTQAFKSGSTMSKWNILQSNYNQELQSEEGGPVMTCLPPCMCDALEGVSGLLFEDGE